MKLNKEEKEPMFRINVQDIKTKKIKGFNIYDNGNKIKLDYFVNRLKKKVEEID